MLNKLLGYKLSRGFNNRKMTKARKKERQIIQMKNGKSKTIIHENR